MTTVADALAPLLAVVETPDKTMVACSCLCHKWPYQETGQGIEQPDHFQDACYCTDGLVPGPFTALSEALWEPCPGVDDWRMSTHHTHDEMVKAFDGQCWDCAGSGYVPRTYRTLPEAAGAVAWGLSRVNALEHISFLLAHSITHSEYEMQEALNGAAEAVAGASAKGKSAASAEDLATS